MIVEDYIQEIKKLSADVNEKIRLHHKQIGGAG